MTFRNSEKLRYRKTKMDTKLFGRKAQKNGHYNNISRDFCLVDNYSSENLYKDIRQPAIEYFEARNITWHDGLDNGRRPSNHLCCSQSCCVNFLYPMTTNPRMIADIFQHFYRKLAEPLLIDEDLPLPNGSFPYMAFEWIGVCDYLGETKRKGSRRTRGAHFTSADFVFRFRRTDGKIQIVLGEWKYTEQYGRSNKGIEVRKQNYRQAFNRDGGVFKRRDEDFYDALFFDPFYQLMRLQLLAQEMEINKEMDADMVTVMHVCPVVNKEFRKHVTSSYLERNYPEKGVLEIWKELIPEDEFMSISVEDLLQTIQQVWVDDKEWVDYLRTRYGWKTSTK